MNLGRCYRSPRYLMDKAAGMRPETNGKGRFCIGCARPTPCGAGPTASPRSSRPWCRPAARRASLDAPLQRIVADTNLGEHRHQPLLGALRADRTGGRGPPPRRGTAILASRGSCSAPGPEDLYDVINERYEKASIALTSKPDQSGWPDLVGEPRLASAALERLIHGAHFVEVTGPPFRAQHAKAQLPTARRAKTDS